MISVRSSFMTAQELADYLRIDREWLYVLAHAGKIRGVQVGRKWLFDPEQVVESLEVRVGGLEGDFNECGYDDDEGREAAIRDGNGGPVSNAGTGGPPFGHRPSISADLDQPL